MRHHVDRALEVYRSRGLGDLVRTAGFYLPIELNNLLFRARYGSSTLVMEEDWDTLILLDACRYDMFADQIEITGDLQSRISAGSTSEEFLDRNFGSDSFHDTVYINTNPYLPKLDLDSGTFHAVVDLLDEWDDELETVHPETVVEAALDAHKRFPNKRLIIHFMQPHFPFIGETGCRVSAKGWSTGRDDGVNGETVWQQLRGDGDGPAPDLELVWTAYRENLDIVLSHVQRLLRMIDGKTVLSSDHGNMVGERLRPIPSRRIYGHYYGMYTPELVKVPWHVIESEQRREIVSETPIEQEQQTDSVVEERLDALGYQ
jgi:hypothetical protein